MNMKNLSDVESDRIKRNLEFIIIHCVEVESDDIKFVYSTGFDFAIEIIIGNLLDKDKTSETTKRYCVKNAIKRFLKYKKYKNGSDVVKLFQEAFYLELKRVERSPSKYSILMFLNVNLIQNTGFNKMSILGDVLKILRWSGINYRDIDEAWKWLSLLNASNKYLTELDSLRSMPSSIVFSPIRIDLIAPDISTAVELAIERLDILRSFFNLSWLHINNHLYDNTLQSRKKVNPSPYYFVFDKSGGLLNQYYSTECYDYKTNYLSKSQADISTHLLSKFKNRIELKSSLEHFRQTLLLYQKALDVEEITEDELAFWRVLERAVSFGKERITYERKISRLSNLLGPDIIIKDILNIVVDNRNRFVHSGISSELSENKKINTIAKVLAKNTIDRLYSLVQEYPSRNQVREYLSLSGKRKQELEQTKSIIVDILSKINN